MLHCKSPDLSHPKTYQNPINGEFTTILQSSEDTAGAFSQLEVKLNAGGKNPLHFHYNFTEEFEAVEGILHLEANGSKIQLQPGEKLSVSPRTAHRFYNPGDENIIFRVKLFPGQPGFEQFIKATFGLINDGKTYRNQIPKSIFHAAILLHWGDTHLTSYAFKVGEPMLKSVYRYAVRKGIEARLYEQYCID